MYSLMHHSVVLSSPERGPWDHWRTTVLSGRWRHQSELYVRRIVSPSETYLVHQWKPGKSRF